MKKLFWAFIFLGFALVNGQAFDLKTYAEVNGFVSLVETPNHEYFGVSVARDTAGNQRIVVHKLDSLLNWVDTVAVIDSVCVYQDRVNISTTQEGKIVIGTRKPVAEDTVKAYIICMDTTGEILWRNFQFYTFSCVAPGVCPSHTGGVVVVTNGDTIVSDSSVTMTVIKFSEDGEIVWISRFGEDWEDYYTDEYMDSKLSPCIDGGYILTGIYLPVGSWEPEYFVLRLDEYGDSLWFVHSRIGLDLVEVYDITQLSDSGFVISGHYNTYTFPDAGFLIKFSRNGFREWTKTFIDTVFRGWAGSLKELATDSAFGFWAIGRSVGAFYGSWIVKFNDSGDTLWSVSPLAPADWEEPYIGFSKILVNHKGEIVTAGVKGRVPEGIDSAAIVVLRETDSIKVVLPNGGEQWRPGETHTIFWISSGIAAVNITYSTDNGASWTPLASDIPSNGYYQWTVPGSISDQCLIKVEDASLSGISDVSDSVFSITDPTEPQITLLVPNGGEYWNTEDTRIILWDYASVESVRLQYSTDNGSVWEEIASVENTGMYEWTIPFANSPNCLIKISDLADSSVQDISDSTFEIENTNPIIILLYPTEGDTLIADSTITIRWMYDELLDSTFQVMMSLDNGASYPYVMIVEGTSYDWTVPDTVVDSCRIKVCTLDTVVSDSSKHILDGTPLAEVISPPIPIRRNNSINPAVPLTHTIEVYPNPFNSACHIVVPPDKAAKVKIYDLQGHQIACLPPGCSVWKPEGACPSGIYIINITTPSGKDYTAGKVLYLK